MGDSTEQKDFKLNEQEIKELDEMIHAVMEKCLQLKVPMFVTIAVSNQDNTTQYLRQIVSAHHLKFKLYNDQINEHMKISNGFKAVPGRECFMVGINELYNTNSGDDDE